MNLKSLMLTSAIFFNNVPSVDYLDFYSGTNTKYCKVKDDYYYSYNSVLDEYLDALKNEGFHLFNQMVYLEGDEFFISQYDDVTGIDDVSGVYTLDEIRDEITDYFGSFDIYNINAQAIVSSYSGSNTLEGSIFVYLNDEYLTFESYMVLESDSLLNYDFTNQDFEISFDLMEVPEFESWIKYDILGLEEPTSLTQNLFNTIGETISSYVGSITTMFNDLMLLFYADNKLTYLSQLLLVGIGIGITKWGMNFVKDKVRL